MNRRDFTDTSDQKTSFGRGVARMRFIRDWAQEASKIQVFGTAALAAVALGVAIWCFIPGS
jgi:hypothetical protein